MYPTSSASSRSRGTVAPTSSTSRSPRRRTILETNGRRWHDDAKDYEHDNEKWSVPCRHGYRIVLATREKITRDPNRLLGELTSTLAAAG